MVCSREPGPQGPQKQGAALKSAECSRRTLLLCITFLQVWRPVLAAAHAVDLSAVSSRSCASGAMHCDCDLLTCRPRTLPDAHRCTRMRRSRSSYGSRIRRRRLAAGTASTAPPACSSSWGSGRRRCRCSPATKPSRFNRGNAPQPAADAAGCRQAGCMLAAPARLLKSARAVGDWQRAARGQATDLR